MDPPISSKEEVVGLPPGWRKRVVVRANGLYAGKIDFCCYSPCGKKFRSVKKLQKFLGKDFDLSSFVSAHEANVCALRNSTLLNLDRPSSRLDGLKHSGSTCESEGWSCPSSRSVELKHPGSRPANERGCGELSAVEGMPTELAAVDGHGDAGTGIINTSTCG